MQCLTIDSDARPSVKQLLSHPWVLKNIRAMMAEVVEEEGAGGLGAAAGLQEDTALFRLADIASTSSAQSPASALAASGPLAAPLAYPSEDISGSEPPRPAAPSGKQHQGKAVEMLMGGEEAMKGAEGGSLTGQGSIKQDEDKNKAQMGFIPSSAGAVALLPAAQADSTEKSSAAADDTAGAADADAAGASNAGAFTAAVEFDAGTVAIATDAVGAAAGAGADAEAQAARAAEVAKADVVDNGTSSRAAAADTEAKQAAQAVKAGAAGRAADKAIAGGAAGETLVTGTVTVVAQAYGIPALAPAEISAPGGAAAVSTELSRTSVVLVGGVTLVIVAAAAAYLAAYGVTGATGGG